LKLQEVTHSSLDPLISEQKPSAVRAKLESVVAQLNRIRDAPWKEVQHEWWAELFE
jgi:hypothetical protein